MPQNWLSGILLDIQAVISFLCWSSSEADGLWSYFKSSGVIWDEESHAGLWQEFNLPPALRPHQYNKTGSVKSSKTWFLSFQKIQTHSLKSEAHTRFVLLQKCCPTSQGCFWEGLRVFACTLRIHNRKNLVEIQTNFYKLHLCPVGCLKSQPRLEKMSCCLKNVFCLSASCEVIQSFLWKALISFHFLVFFHKAETSAYFLLFGEMIIKPLPQTSCGIWSVFERGSVLKWHNVLTLKNFSALALLS